MVAQRASRLTAAVAATVLFTFAAPAVAGPLERGRDYYYERRFDAALEQLRVAAEDPESDPAARVEALKLQAFIHFIQGDRDPARRVWRRLLRLDPEHALDPVKTSPELRDFFSAIPAPQPEPAEREIRARPLTEPEPRLSANPRGCGVALCLVPFGVGQLANDRPLKAGLFAGLELLFVGLNVGLYWNLRVEYDRQGFFDDPDAARGKNRARNVFFGLFVATAVAGVIDAWLFP